MRINQYLAQATGLSRRASDREIEAGKVRVNGAVAVHGVQVDPAKDRVEFGGRLLALREGHVTIALYKPAGYVTSRKKESEDPIVMELLPPDLRHLRPVGRLDRDSEGLLLLSSDGALIQRSTHPSYETEKEYLMELSSPAKENLAERFLRGIRFPEGIARADNVVRETAKRWRVVLHQGFNRQVRRMASRVGTEVVRLVRVRSGDIALGDLQPGEWRRIVFDRKKPEPRQSDRG